jgi:predicted GNAT family acetyltransferase
MVGLRSIGMTFEWMEGRGLENYLEDHSNNENQRKTVSNAVIPYCGRKTEENE